uniref:DUF7043 domain-containing protein n=1 Tax=Timema shepardi TaxID=629360 RepID=A0A7R9B765_TIMSH|nr:unnamed protein product [Timema shepardi]
MPQNFSGDWINTANIDADIVINETHIIETWYPDEGRYRKTIYVCREQRDTRYMMARLTVDGWFVYGFQGSYHHNVIRYRRGVAVIIDDFHTVCSWVQFKNEVAWKYSLYLAKNPIPVRCPIAGKFNFTQKGEVPFETRILGGVTLSPRPNIYCKQNISDFSVCDTDQKEVSIDETYCLSVDYLGRPVDIYMSTTPLSVEPLVGCRVLTVIWQVRNKTLSLRMTVLTLFCPLTGDPDYRMKCIGFWKENLKSYLITYDELDPFSKYRCWVYQRADLNRVLISQAIGPFCDLKQDVTSWNSSEGASVALEMQEYERERVSRLYVDIEGVSRLYVGIEGVSRLYVDIEGVSRLYVGIEGVSRLYVDIEGVSRLYVDIEGVSRLYVDIEGVSILDVDIEGECLDYVDIEGVSRLDVDIEGVSRLDVDIEGVSRLDLDIEGLSRLNVDIGVSRLLDVDIEGVYRLYVDIKGVSRPDVDIEGVSRPDVDIEGVSRPDVDIEGVSRLDLDIEGVSRLDVDIEGEVALRVSHSSLMSSDRMKPRSGNWAVRRQYYKTLEQCYNARDQCPMYFDDGSNPWLQTENYIKVFHFGYYAGATLVFNSTFCLVLALMFYMCAWRRMSV